VDNLGWSEKKILRNRKKCSTKILPNTLKLPKKLVLAGCTLWGASSPLKYLPRGKIAPKCHNSQTTYRRYLVFGSKFAELPCFYKCLELFLYLYYKKVTIDKSIFSIYSQEKLVKISAFLQISCVSEFRLFSFWKLHLVYWNKLA